ncbi:MAG: MBL fold metallo-hydrolase, partial [Ignavibacteria bacterium]
MKKSFLIPLILVFLISAAVSQDNPKVPTAKVTQLDKNLYEISMQTCNILASIGLDGVLLVDANYKECGKYMTAEIEKLGGVNINYIINTHWHFDHTGGNQVIGNKNTIIIAHKDAKELLLKDQFLLGDTINALPEYALPKITFDKSYDLDFNGEKIELIALSGGHSAGDIIVYFKKSNILHIGDIIFSDMFPFADYDHGGSVFTLEKNIQKIIDMFPDDVKIIPGHGRICTKDDLKKYREMVIATSEIVKEEKDKGKS